jgi:hypothetical protein
VLISSALWRMSVGGVVPRILLFILLGSVFLIVKLFIYNNFYSRAGRNGPRGLLRIQQRARLQVHCGRRHHLPRRSHADLLRAFLQSFRTHHQRPLPRAAQPPRQPLELDKQLQASQKRGFGKFTARGGPLHRFYTPI